MGIQGNWSTYFPCAFGKCPGLLHCTLLSTIQDYENYIRLFFSLMLLNLIRSSNLDYHFVILAYE